MFFEKELHLLCSTFSKSHIPVTLSSVSKPELSSDFGKLDLVTKQLITKYIFESSVARKLEQNTVYKLKIDLSLSFMFLFLPSAATDTLLILGPYTHEGITEQKILQYIESQGISSSYQKALTDYCETIAVISENSTLFTLLDSFCEQIWGASFSVVDINSEVLLPDLPIISKGEAEQGDTMIDMKNIEYRYSLENELLDAVRQGNIKRVGNTFTNFSEQHFEMRTTDPLRNSKNYCIIMNTLLRKSAEQGGVHPLYIDRTSSRFATEIEMIDSNAKLPYLMKTMFEGYCRLVKKHATKKFSPIVEKAVLIIDSDFSLPLSLSSISEQIGISKVYLSSLFKKEVGKTVTDYIKEKRMNKAAFLLRTSSLQIQNIALYSGIEDVQYFSKLFKSSFGKTPKEYRQEMTNAEKR